MDEYEERFCIFLDILGFKEHVTASAEQSREGRDRLAALNDLMTAFAPVPDHAQRHLLADQRETQFSDSLVISCSNTMDIRQNQHPEYVVLVRLHYMLLKLLSLGFLVRGGLARGKLVHRGTKVFGPALNDAVALEKKAIFPRVMLQDGLIEQLRVRPTDEETHYIYGLVRQDDAGVASMEYLRIDQISCSVRPIPLGHREREWCHRLATIVEEGLQHSDERVQDKYKWIAKGLHRTVHALAREDGPIGLMPPGVMAQWGDLLTRYEPFANWTYTPPVCP